MPWLWDELFRGFPAVQDLASLLLRLVIACLLGGVVGWERQRAHKWAGLRTHLLVALGAALFTVGPSLGKMPSADLSRVIQGIAAGIGFLGAGTILKLSAEKEIEGLTSAASIWVMAAIGLSVGAGWAGPAILGTLLCWIILRFVHGLERSIPLKKDVGPLPPAHEPH